MTIFLTIQCILLKFFFEKSKKAYDPSKLKIIRISTSIIAPLSFALIFLLFQILIMWIKNAQIVNLIEDQQSYAYYSLALRISEPAGYVSEWLREMQIPLLYWGGHMATHLPGYPLIIYIAFQIFGKNSYSVMYVVSIFSSLTIFPIFWISNLIYDWRVAVLSCALYSWVPSLILNFPYMDLILGFFVCLSVLFFLYSFRTQNKVMSLIGGLILSLCIFMSYVSASILVMVFIFTIFSNKSKKLMNLVFYFLGTVFPYILLEVIIGWPIIQATLSAHQTNSWFYWHLYSLNPLVWNMWRSTLFFFMFIGLPVCIVFFIALIRSLRYFFHEHEKNTFVLSFAAVLLITILVAKLELARVASFLIPFIVIIASGEIMKLKNEDGLATNSIILTIAQFIVFFVHLSQVDLYSSLLGYPIV
ncbi:glycosyltransferase family 39 protein [[Eubacterium] cellulosolvens]